MRQKDFHIKTVAQVRFKITAEKNELQSKIDMHHTAVKRWICWRIIVPMIDLVEQLLSHSKKPQLNEIHTVMIFLYFPLFFSFSFHFVTPSDTLAPLWHHHDVTTPPSSTIMLFTPLHSTMTHTYSTQLHYYVIYSTLFQFHNDSHIPMMSSCTNSIYS